jgi:hypothetical protein
VEEKQSDVEARSRRGGALSHGVLQALLGELNLDHARPAVVPGTRSTEAESGSTPARPDLGLDGVPDRVRCGREAGSS